MGEESRGGALVPNNLPDKGIYTFRTQELSTLANDLSKDEWYPLTRLVDFM